MPIDVDAFERFLDELLPADQRGRVLSLEDMARILQDVRTWFTAAGVPLEEQRAWAASFFPQLLRAQPAMTDADHEANLAILLGAFNTPLPTM